MEYGEVQCKKCRSVFGVSLSLSNSNQVKVASCKVCPVNHVYAVCGRCADIEQVNNKACPSCGASDLWEIRGMVQK